MVSDTPHRSCWGVSFHGEGQHSLTMHENTCVPVTAMNVSTSLLTSGGIVGARRLSYATHAMHSKDVVSIDMCMVCSRVSVEQAGRRSMESAGGGSVILSPLPSCYRTCCMLAVAAHGLRPCVHPYHPHAAGPVCKCTPPASIGTR